MNKVYKLIQFLKNYFYKGNQRSIKAKKNIVASFGIKGVALLIGLVKIPILLTYLDVEKYGVWLTIASIVDWIHYFDLGIGHGLRNKFAEALAFNDYIKARKLVSTAYFYITVIFIGAGILLIPVVFLLDWPQILNTSIIDSKELSYSVVFVLIMFVLRFILYQISVILKADQRPAVSDVFLPVANVLTLIIVSLLGLFSKNSLFLACIAVSAPPVLILLIANLYYFKKKYKLFAPSVHYIDKTLFKGTFTLGLNFFIIQLAGLVMFASSNIILSQIVNPSEVTLYNISRQYFNIPFMIFGIILTPFWSGFTDAYVRNDFIWIKRIMNKLFKLSLLFCLGEILMFISAPIAYKIWIGDSLMIPTSLSLITSIMFTFYIIFAPFTHFINGVGKLRISIIICILAMFIYLPTAICFTKLFGATGLVLSMVLVNSIPSALVEPIQYFKIINKKAKGFWNK